MWMTRSAPRGWSRRIAPTVILLTSGAGCTEPVIRWTEPKQVGVQAAQQLHLDGMGAPVLSASHDTAVTPPRAACAGSIRTATRVRGRHRVRLAVWWSPRADGSAALLAAESDSSGERWSAITTVDSLDRGRNGCSRPPPAVATDSASGYVHVAYPLWAPEGAGIFFAHAMPGPLLFHEPVVVSYGDRPGRASVAASGDHVAVAYEDPNARRPRVGLALSRTQGHVFEEHLVAAAGPGDASEPRVAMRGSRIALLWERTGAGGTTVAMLRLGTIVR